MTVSLAGVTIDRSVKLFGSQFQCGRTDSDASLLTELSRFIHILKRLAGFFIGKLKSTLCSPTYFSAFGNP